MIDWLHRSRSTKRTAMPWGVGGCGSPTDEEDVPTTSPLAAMPAAGVGAPSGQRSADSGAEIRVGYSPRPPPSSWIWPNLISWPHWHHHWLARPHQTRRRLSLLPRRGKPRWGATSRSTGRGSRRARDVFAMSGDFNLTLFNELEVELVGGEPSRRCLLQGAQRRGWRDRRFL